MRKQIAFSIIGMILVLSVISFATPLGETILKSIGVISVDKEDLTALTSKGMNEFSLSDLTCNSNNICHYYIKDLNGKVYTNYLNRNLAIYKNQTNDQVVLLAHEKWLKERIANEKIVENKNMTNKISVQETSVKPIEEPIEVIK